MHVQPSKNVLVVFLVCVVVVVLFLLHLEDDGPGLVEGPVLEGVGGQLVERELRGGAVGTVQTDVRLVLVISISCSVRVLLRR